MMTGRILWYSGTVLFYLLPILLVILIILMRRYQWLTSTAHLLGMSSLKHFSLLRKAIKLLLLASSFFFLILALARPQWGSVRDTVSQEGRDLLIVLDVSRSMLAQDIKPSRFAFAKEKIRALVHQLTAERVGLMIFSSDAIVQCPFTADIHAFMRFLDLVEVEPFSWGTTALDRALIRSIEAFKKVPQRKHKIVALFTDGEDFSLGLESVKEQAKKAGLTLFTIGIGTQEGAPIPLYDEHNAFTGYQKDDKGSIVITRLQEKTLADIAQKTGAEYMRATEDESDIEWLVSEVHRFEKEKFDDKTFATKQERFGPFAALSALLLLIEWLL
jgi:Ca-activated chloride channel homolog